MPILTTTEQIKLFSAFIESKGIVCKQTLLSPPFFLPGLKINGGVLFYDPEQLLYPGDMLHEAGHIAVTRAEDRTGLHDNVTTNHPDKEGEEMAVLLWTYAACIELNILPEYVFHKQGYKNQSDWLIDNYQSGNYLGLPLLIWMGMTDAEMFPKMKNWLRA